MILPENNNPVKRSGEMATSQFGISEGDQSHILSILRDKLYSDKLAAPLREYGTNALDAHREAKISRPIKVTLPTTLSPTLIIRDFGSGLSEEDVRTIYVKYGRSTKRNTNDAIGQLGLGCKSAFAYTNMFTIVSYHQGLKTTYCAYLDEENIGAISDLGSEPTTETGLEIRIEIKASEVNLCRTKAQSVFAYFDPRPEINIDLPVIEYSLKGNHWGCRKRDDGTGSRAIMGAIAYPISKEIATTSTQKLILDAAVDIHFPIGSLEISASREALEYKSATKKMILTRIEAVENELTADIEAQFQATPNTWAAQHLYHSLSNSGGLVSHLAITKYRTWKGVDLDRSGWLVNSYIPEGAKLYIHKSADRQICRKSKYSYKWNMNYNTKVVIIWNDEATTWTKRLAHWRDHNKSEDCIIITGTKSDIDKYIAKFQVDGIPVIQLSTQPASAFDITIEEDEDSDTPAAVAKPKDRTKQKAKVFQLNADLSLDKHPKSDNWAAAEVDIAEDESIYMVIHAFLPQDPDEEKLLELLKRLDIKSETLFGIRKELKDKMGPGWKPFKTWALEEIRKAVLASPILKILEGAAVQNYHVIPTEYDGVIASELPDPDILKAVQAIRDGKAAFSTATYEQQRTVSKIQEYLSALNITVNENVELVKQIEARYFLLKGIAFFGNNGRMIVKDKEYLSEIGEYIKLKKENK